MGRAPSVIDVWGYDMGGGLCTYFFAVSQCVRATPCFPGVECVDYDDGYKCLECPSGYTGETVRGYDLNDANTIQQVHTLASFSHAFLQYNTYPLLLFL